MKYLQYNTETKYYQLANFQDIRNQETKEQRNQETMSKKPRNSNQETKKFKPYNLKSAVQLSPPLKKTNDNNN